MYKNGKIYKLVSDNTNNIYIGSTCNKLCKRLYHHRWDAKNHQISSSKLFIYDDIKIILIEDYPCERKEQLLSRERYWIEINKDLVINKNIPSRSSKEYKSTDTYKNYRNLKNKCECGKTFLIINKNRHEKSKKHIDYLFNDSSKE